ncbi:SRPBCC family protein [Nocardioides zeae]|uniref:SRPBCC family protein n=1 Tax=Nocardioides imazamoxiresistens TaxID=3231893 RepID=A0ABU3Q2B1_9ACTN|nr:SRPBCC family protein [Nocardioides zeae]MDT9595185.1 SRPBCC family protein [Nocardioides zeae]
MTTGPTTSSNPDVTVVTEPGQPTVRITREFDAPPARVFAAHVDPDLFAQWVGPADLTTEIRAWDATTGGRWSYVARRGDEAYAFFGSFHEIREGERIVQTFTFEGAPDSVSLEVLTLVPLDGGRTRLEALSVFESVASRDQMVASGMEHGVAEGYRSLDALLASPRASS